jgi:hypothetical protein
MVTKSTVERTCTADSASYNIHEHRHRFAAWAASRAASVKGCRFSAEQGKAILERAGQRALIDDPDRLPDPTALCIDLRHNEWRAEVIRVAQREFHLPFTHGVAAKLINMYLKAAFVCGGFDDHERVCQLHPPVDGLLLDSLHTSAAGGAITAAVWETMRHKRWSKFNAEDYQSVIDAIRAVVGPAPLWAIEEHWRGFQ